MLFRSLSTTIITNLHKIPVISRVIDVLSLSCGRTTWWKILVMVRKIFVNINAIIGMYAIIKVLGFSMNNIAVDISAIGYSYV